MNVIEAPQHIRTAVHTIIVGHMASSLIAHKALLHDPASCRKALLDAGFGEPSVKNLLDRAIAAARASLNAEHPEN